jgi:hypothetical protein
VIEERGPRITRIDAKEIQRKKTIRVNSRHPRADLLSFLIRVIRAIRGSPAFISYTLGLRAGPGVVAALLLPRSGPGAALQTARVRAAASRLFRLSVDAGATCPGSTLAPNVSETTTGDWEDSPEIEVLQQQALGFDGVVESPPALAATQDVVCRNRRTPNSRLPRLTPV